MSKKQKNTLRSKSPLPIQEDFLTEREFLEQYRSSDYERPSVTVDIALFTVDEEESGNHRKNEEKKLKLLLMRREHHPFKGRWALPGSFVGIEENLEDAAYRIMKEKTAVPTAYLDQLYTWGEKDRDPRLRIISVSYLALLRQGCLDLPGDKASLCWFDIGMKRISKSTSHTDKGEEIRQVDLLRFVCEDREFEVEVETRIVLEGGIVRRSMHILKDDHLAFDHAKIIVHALQRLRQRIEYDNIAFSLMPEEFTLTQLQQVYEIILDQKLLKANFRRKVASMVEETDNYKKDAAHRPSRLYRFVNRFS
ncbi:MAG: NUDIX domain-containing protein [Filifactor alocis]|nr:NUDIX domain-containing protein [Filifactor alocis]